MIEIALIDQGLELRRAGHEPVRLPWAVIGLLQIDGASGRMRIHLADGRAVEVAVRSDPTAVLAAWRAQSTVHGGQPRDVISPAARRATAAQIDLAELEDAGPVPPRIGGVYRHGWSRAIVDGQGVSIVRPAQGRLRIPWPAVRSVLPVEVAGVRPEWLVRIRLHDLTNYLLPAPRTRAGLDDPSFQRALGEITAAWRSSRPAPGEPADRITEQMRRDAVREVRYEK